MAVTKPEVNSSPRHRWPDPAPGTALLVVPAIASAARPMDMLGALGGFGDDAAEEEAALISASITDEQLQALTGSLDLGSVTLLQMAVDAAHVPLCR